MSGKAPEKPDSPKEDTFSECFGKHLDATQIENNKETYTKGDRPHYPFITEAAFQFSDRQIGGERQSRRQSTRQSSSLHPVSEAIETDQNTIPISRPKATQAQCAAGVPAKTLPCQFVHT